MNAKQKLLIGFGLVWTAFTVVLVFFVLPAGLSRGILVDHSGRSVASYQQLWLCVLVGGGFLNLLYLLYSNRHK